MCSSDLFAITTGSLPSNTATQEFVVPKSIPIIFHDRYSFYLLLFNFFLSGCFLSLCKSFQTDAY